MRWLVTGAHGQLGTHVVARLDAAGGDVEVLALGRPDLDVTDADAVTTAVSAFAPDVVVNAAAYTGVDAAETDEGTAYAVNALAVEHLARAARQHRARFIHVSTDYVFDGRAERPYEPGDPTGPATAYGRTKLAGEQAARAHGGHVVRTAWVFGGPGPNFVDTMRRLAVDRPTVDVVDDQVGSPTYVADLAAAVVELGRSTVAPAVLHYTNAGTATWFQLAQAVFRLSGHDPERVRPVDSASFVRPAPRPRWSVLSTAGWVDQGLTPPPEWTQALARCLAESAP